MKLKSLLVMFIICVIWVHPFAKAKSDHENLKLIPANKSTFIATGLSFLFPGLGHFYLGDNSTALGLAGLGLGEIGLVGLRATQLKQDQLNTDPWFMLSTNLFQQTWSYGMYAAYRDTRTANLDQGYQFKMPKDSLADLAMAPFNWRVLKKPEVWAGIVGSLVIGIGISYLSEAVFPNRNQVPENDLVGDLAKTNFLSRELYLGTFFMPVGIGEEAVFRGFLQPALSEPFGKWGGLTASSLVFGAAHIPNAFMMSDRNAQIGYFVFGLPFITLLGGYLGWMAMKNTSLKESVAVHGWYDFLLVSIAAVTHKSSPGTRGFSFTIPF